MAEKRTLYVFGQFALCAPFWRERFVGFRTNEGENVEMHVEMRRPGPVERFFLKEYSAFHLLGQIEFFVIFIFVI